MQVADLIRRLEKLPRNAHVVVGNDVVHDIEVQMGRIECGYYNPQWVRDPRGKETAIRLCANYEISTGEVVSGPR